LDVVWCQHRSYLDTDDYWCGLYKLNGNRWYATWWLDGESSAWREWASGYPKHSTATCVRYTKDGLKDKACDEEYYYTCKKAAGSSLSFSLLSVYNYFCHDV